MTTMPGSGQIDSIENLYAHAIALEREAADQYAALGNGMQLLGNSALAELFLRLADDERGHQHELEQRASGLTLPQIDAGAYAWMYAEAPETIPGDRVTPSLSPQAALELALEAEHRAYAFFDSARINAKDPAVAAMAAEMANEEGVHIAWVKSALRRSQDPQSDEGNSSAAASA